MSDENSKPAMDLPLDEEEIDISELRQQISDSKVDSATHSTALIKLDGTMIREDGTTCKSNFFNFLGLDQDTYTDITFTAEEARMIKQRLRGLSTGSSAAIPLICGGPEKCPFAERCVFVQLDKVNKANGSSRRVTPVGRQCLVELNLINEWTRYYAIEYELDENSFTELQMVRELAEIELMLWRINNNLAKPEHAVLTQTTTVGIDKQGNVHTREEVSAFFEAKERLQNRKSKLIKLMVGDRQEKYKREAALKQKDVRDASSSAAQLKARIIKQLETLKKETTELQEKDGSIIDVEVEEVKVVVNPEDYSIQKKTKESERVLSPEDLINSEVSGKDN